MSYGEPRSGQGPAADPHGYGPGYGQPYGQGYGAPEQPSQAGTRYGVPAAGDKPATYRGAAITAAIFGIFFSLLIGLPTGYAAAQYGRKVDIAWQDGDVADAALASRRARAWLIVSVFFDAVGLIFVIYLIVHGNANSATV